MTSENNATAIIWKDLKKKRKSTSLAFSRRFKLSILFIRYYCLYLKLQNEKLRDSCNKDCTALQAEVSICCVSFVRLKSPAKIEAKNDNWKN